MSRVQSEPNERVIADAIKRSISHNEIVSIDDQAGLRRDLRAECDGDVVTVAHHEFWGTDVDSNHHWRVHVRI